MKRILCAVFAAVLLTGCSYTGQTYIHVTPHSERTDGYTTGSAPVENYQQLSAALRGMVESGTQSGVIYTLKMDSDQLEQNMRQASAVLCREDPIGAYAVEDIAYEIGTTGGKTGIAVTVTYRRSEVEIRKILRLDNMAQMEKAVREALDSCSSGVVMLVRDYTPIDFVQLVQDIAYSRPNMIMEIPEVSEAEYGTGTERVVTLAFSYTNSRDSLRQMQQQVRPVFDSAALYVSGSSSDNQKLSQLYAFLMERFDYAFDTSITPSYSLLCHGVGDSRAFAVAYAAMCSRAGLECKVVTGARNAEPWTWNIVCDDGEYHHVDLLACYDSGEFLELGDEEMSGYVWDYSAYPQCVSVRIPVEAVEAEIDEIITEDPL